MNPSTAIFPEGSQPLWFKVYADEEMRTLMRMSNDERGLFTSLRWYAITCENFSGDPEEMWQDVKNFCGISRYKFRKLLPRVLKFFAKSDTGFFFERDEERISESRANVANSRKLGQLAAQARWSKRPETTKEPTPIRNADAYADAYAEPTTRESDIDTGEPPPPTTGRELGNLAEAVGGGGSPTSQSPPNNKTDGYHEFVEHCKTKGLSPGGKVLWSKIRAKFGTKSTSEVLQNLPLFDGQDTAGLWDHHTALLLAEESERQRNPKKTVQNSRTKETFAERLSRL